MSNHEDWKLIESLVVRAACGQRVVLREGMPRRGQLCLALLRYVNQEEWHSEMYGMHGELGLLVTHSTSGGMIDVVRPDLSRIGLAGSKILDLREVCFGCGATRKVDRDPLWQYVVVFRGVSNPISLCNDCGPVVQENMTDREDITNMNEFEDVLGKRPWLADHTDKFMLDSAIKHWTTGIGYESVIDRSGLEGL